METIYRKVLTEERFPETDQRFISIDYYNDKINEVELMVLDSEKKKFFYFPSDIHTEAPEYWLEEVPDRESELIEMLERLVKNDMLSHEGDRIVENLLKTFNQ